MIVLYAGFRFGIDFVRYHESAANFWINQSTSLGLAAVGVAMAVFASRRTRDNGQVESPKTEV